MRLTAIKLAGFKSFVDPTELKFSTNLSAIVGPNGCGKSNVIDAVRWVMGESSAKQLRGEAMSDVIFNGSSQRKPVGSASVELLFDNSDGRAGGEYASYNEISVRRQVSRDGQSAYYLNGTRCRRKDITDLFLGTGLGPRSYSLIEQGMISQVVEARPEELRHYLEEAAGISRYRERRRETENRIRRTRENLERLNDLRDEVTKQLDKLQRQARAAERYKKLQRERRQRGGNLLALQWREVQAQLENARAEERRVENQRQQAVAQQRSAETELTNLREQQNEAQESFNRVQGELYEVGSKIARAEQSIEHQRDLRERQRKELEQVEASLSELEQHRGLDEARIAGLREALGQAEPQLAAANDRVERARGQAATAEAEWRQLADALREHQQRSSERSQQAEVARARIEHLDEQVARDLDTIDKLRAERARHDAETLRSEHAGQRDKAEQARKRVAEIEQRISELRAELDRQKASVEDTGAQLQARQRGISEDEGRQSSLQAMQEAELRGSDDSLQQWLERQGIDQAPRLAQQIETDPEWTLAVETVLGDFLQAVVTDEPHAHLDDLESLDHASLSLIGPDPVSGAAVDGSLAARVRGAACGVELLSRVRCASDRAQALNSLPSIPAGGSVITPQGDWIGHGWARVNRGAGKGAGILEREQELRRLEDTLQERRRSAAELEERLATERDRQHQLEEQLEQARLEHNQAHHAASSAESAAEQVKSRLETAETRAREIDSELETIRERVESHNESARDKRGELQAYLDAMSELESERERLEQRRQSAEQAYNERRREFNEAEQQRQELAVKVESNRASLESLEQAQERVQQQFDQLQERHRELSAALSGAGEPDAGEQQNLDALLKQRVQVEENLNRARAQLDELAEQSRQAEARRQQAAASAEDLRESGEQARLKLKELELHAEDYARRVGELDLDSDLQTLVEQLPAEADAEAWQQQLDKIDAGIRRLEPVNLAAIQEYEQEQERKSYLDRQDADLQEALQTLENAIARIDRTTRSRFRDTFEQVQHGLGELFPRLFGGGHAYIEMTGEDLLTTGIAIMARPPGKRVSSIHLLSGGEKAMTAVAFVFAIFELNPAPFCMLDEVDAPLDDANVGRFTALVKEMSERVEFVVVTHNKVTMETADQLIGVTMREAGVSRLVTVDLEEAAAMAAG